MKFKKLAINLFIRHTKHFLNVKMLAPSCTCILILAQLPANTHFYFQEINQSTTLELLIVPIKYALTRTQMASFQSIYL